VRESPSLKIIQLLKQRLARVSYHDPYVPRLESRHLSRAMVSEDLTPENLAAKDAVVIVTDHSIVDYAMVLQHAKLVVDTRNATGGLTGPKQNVILA
jgi:UDP-N-acetyl-D-glucosamine dehydrogenase